MGVYGARVRYRLTCDGVHRERARERGVLRRQGHVRDSEEVGRDARSSSLDLRVHKSNKNKKLPGVIGTMI